MSAVRSGRALWCLIWVCHSGRHHWAGCDQQGLNGLGGEGVFGELNAGYNHDFGNWVAGVMVDGSYSGISTELDRELWRWHHQRRR